MEKGKDALFVLINIVMCFSTHHHLFGYPLSGHFAFKIKWSNHW